MFSEIFGKASEGVQAALTNMLLLNLLIAGISMVFIESIKVSFEKMIFKKKKAPTIFKWILSLVIVIIVTLLVVGLFNIESIDTSGGGEEELLESLGGNAASATNNIETALTLSHWPLVVLMVITSWSLTTLGYVLIIKMMFAGFKVLYNRAIEYETNSVAASFTADRKKVKTRILLEEEVCLAKLRKADIDRRLTALAAGEVVPVSPLENEEEDG